MQETQIGKLRWDITFAEEVQSMNANGVTSYSYTGNTAMHCNIIPVATMDFLVSMQTEINKITHKIYTRYFDSADDFLFAFRYRIRPDQSVLEEKYRLHRWSEVDGRQRFLMFDAEMISQEVL